MVQVFISYRSSDQPFAVALLDSVLRSRLGTTNVFRESQSIPIGADFSQVILDAVRRSDVLVVVVGPEWSGRDADGRRLIDDPDDWVRREIAEAFRRGISVIPVLVGDAPPVIGPEDLPADIAELARRQSIVIRLRNLEQDLEALTRAIAWLEPSVNLAGPSSATAHDFSSAMDEVAVYTSSDNGERVRDAVLEILSVSGFERVTQGAPISGSWFQRIFVRRVDASAVDKLAEVMGKAERAAELKYIATPRAHNDEREAAAIASLAEAMRDTDEVAIRTSSIVFLKTQGRVLSWVLTEDEIEILNARRDLMRSPHDFIEALPKLREFLSYEVPDSLPTESSKPELPPA